jgi:hypothetical protein
MSSFILFQQFSMASMRMRANFLKGGEIADPTMKAGSKPLAPLKLK